MLATLRTKVPAVGVLALAAALLAVPVPVLAQSAAIAALPLTCADDSPAPGDTLEGTMSTKFLIPWTLHAGVNVDVHPNIEIGSEFRYWLYRQYDEQVIKVTPRLIVIDELRTQKNFHDSWQVSGGVRVHDLRHAHASWLLAGGADLKSVMERMGHAQIQTTQKYLHTLPDTDQRNLDALTRIQDRRT